MVKKIYTWREEWCVQIIFVESESSHKSCRVTLGHWFTGSSHCSVQWNL